MNILNTYPEALTQLKIDQQLEAIQQKAINNYNETTLRFAFSCIDLTTLNTDDTEERARSFADNVNRFPEAFPGTDNVAAICVYPSMVAAVRDELNDNQFSLASVVGGFPSAQTFLSIKTEETRLAVEAGATEVDMVISVGEMKRKNYQLIYDEVKAIKEAAGNAHLKVILETGMLTAEEIWISSLLSMEAGADFIKTSTGKTNPAATPEAGIIMCTAIKAYHEKAGRQVGFKPAGGVRVGKEAALFTTIVSEILGEKWLCNNWFRIGASALANNLLTEINTLNGKDETVSFF